ERALQHRAAHAAEQAARDLFHQRVALGVAEDFAHQRAGLAEVVVIGMQGVGAAHHFAVGFPAVVHRTGLVGPRTAAAVGGVHGLGAAVVVGHLTVEHVGAHRYLGLVDRQLVEVGADAVAL